MTSKNKTRINDLKASFARVKAAKNQATLDALQQLEDSMGNNTPAKMLLKELEDMLELEYIESEFALGPPWER